MAHPDKSWRVAVIYRCCIRYGMSKDWAIAQMQRVFGRFVRVERTVEIWWRSKYFHEERTRHGH